MCIRDRRQILHKRGGQRQTTRRPYGSVILTPPSQPRGASGTPGRSRSQSPRPNILGRVSPVPRSASPSAGASPSLAAASPSPAPSPMAAPVEPSPIQPADELRLPGEIKDAQPKKRRTRVSIAPKKRQRGSSAEAMLALRQVEYMVADSRAQEEEVDMHDMCRKFVKEVAAELSDQAAVIDENAHLMQAHLRLGAQKRALKEQLLHLQQQRSQIGTDLRAARTQRKAQEELLERSSGLSEFLHELQRVQAAAIKKAGNAKVQWDVPQNLDSLVASAARASNNLAALQHTNAHLEALSAVLEGMPK
eukprot:TRINITY_DN16997_c0_g1_i1.p1 TRINITY_DN16997_c0_g1~~TRINITY_DN16997_c0_g1_i1.p1  ORF type:complete len:339 (+),score=90.49 TRINITY_DN16997_c0_g1_i1:102-1019(+)